MARTLTAALLAAQAYGYPTGKDYKPAVRCIFTSKDGVTTHDYSFDPTVTTNRLLHAQQVEERESDSGVILLQNNDRSVPVDLNGYYVDIGWGQNTSSGVLYTEANGAVTPRLWVMQQHDISGGQKDAKKELFTLFQLQGVWSAILNQQPVRLGTAPYYQYTLTDIGNSFNIIPDLTNLTIYGVLEYLIETGLTDQVSHAITAGSFITGTNYRIETVGTTNFTLIGASTNTVDVIFTATGAGSGTGTAKPAFTLEALGTQDDGYINSVIPFPSTTEPKDLLRTINADSPGLFQTYGELIISLLELTKCVLIPRTGLAFKIIYPQSSDTADETYYTSTTDGHPFYEVENRRLNMTPNHVEVFGTDPEANEGHWFDPDHYTTAPTTFTPEAIEAAYTGTFMPVTLMISEDGLDTESEADTRAAELGWQMKDQLVGTRVIIPMDARVEPYDRVQVKDTRS